jgi:hypothetical protein
MLGSIKNELPMWSFAAAEAFLNLYPIFFQIVHFKKQIIKISPKLAKMTKYSKE